MHPRFHPRLINGPFDDPGLFIPFLFENRAVLFDLGDNYSLSTRDILKISHVFITHTHLDHFIGFDRLLRLFLGRDKSLYLYGPKGFFKNVEGKLAGYSWNLVTNYRYRLCLYLTEVHPDYLLTRLYRCQDEFVSTQKAVKNPFSGILHEEPTFSISAVILDHNIPCLGFAINERFHVNIIKDKLGALGLETGPWLNNFKQALYNRTDPDSEFKVIYGKGAGRTKRFMLGELAEQIARITPGQKITYIADVGYNQNNQEKIASFAKYSDQLFIEAAFLEKHRNIAAEKNHLTAWQAGSLAARARVKQFKIFHFSPRYTDQAHLLQQEATRAYEGMIRQKKDA